MKKIYIICSLTCLLASCKPNVTITIPPKPGLASFSNYLAIGDNYTAGFCDNSLTVYGQLNSYPERLFEQFRLIPGINGGSKSYFVQPLLHSDNGYPKGKLVLGYVYNPCTGDSSLTPVNFPNFVADPVDFQRYTWQNSDYNNGQINNIGVPNMRLVDYPVGSTLGIVAFNDYSKRFFHNIATSATVFDELNYRVRNLQPSFFTMWLGLTDILGYAIYGGIGNGTGTASPEFPGTNFYNPMDITPIDIFHKLYDSAVRVATSTGSSGALISIPDITKLPFFTVMPVNGLVITRQTLADSLNHKWASVPMTRAFQLGNNLYMVRDHNHLVRQAVDGELILMTVPLDTVTCSPLGSYTPIGDSFVLTTEEIQMIRHATQDFNEFIYLESLKYHLAFVDMNKYLSSVYSGVVYNGINYNANFVSGGAFSLDGIHPTQRGAALIANQIITTIDSYYHATIPLSDVNKYQGVLFP